MEYDSDLDASHTRQGKDTKVSFNAAQADPYNAGGAQHPAAGASDVSRALDEATDRMGSGHDGGNRQSFLPESGRGTGERERRARFDFASAKEERSWTSI